MIVNLFLAHSIWSINLFAYYISLLRKNVPSFQKYIYYILHFRRWVDYIHQLYKWRYIVLLEQSREKGLWCENKRCGVESSLWTEIYSERCSDIWLYKNIYSCIRKTIFKRLHINLQRWVMHGASIITFYFIKI